METKLKAKTKTCSSVKGRANCAELQTYRDGDVRVTTMKLSEAIIPQVVSESWCSGDENQVSRDFAREVK